MLGMVYVNHGRVIVDCPTEMCGNAYKVVRGQSEQVCNGPGGCEAVIPLAVPDNLSELIRELDKRPRPANRNWFPEGHPMALKGNMPVGQSPEDLSAEFSVMRGE